MSRFRLVAAFAVLALAAPAFATEAAHSPHDAGHPAPEHARPAKVAIAAPVEVAMGAAYSRPTIDVMIDGKGPYKFLVDSGAGSTVINSDLAKELGLKVVDKTHIGDPMNPEAIAAEVVAVPSLSIGGATFSDFQAVSWDRAYLLHGETGEPRGVIGFPLFSQVLLTFDYVDHKLRIAQGDLPKADGKSVIPYTSPMGIPEFNVSLGGVEVPTHLDTGSGGFYSVPKKYLEQLKFKGPLQEVGHARTVNTEMVLKGAELDGALAIGQFRYENPFVIVSDELPMGNFGSRALAPFAITFDQRAQTMRFEQKAPLVAEKMPAPKPQVANASAPQAANASAPPPTSGVRFASHGEGNLEVYDVAPGSPAAKAGVTAGETVLEINGIAIGQMTDDARRAALHTSPVRLKLEKDTKIREVTIVFP